MPLTADQIDELVDGLDAPLLMAEGDGEDLARKALEDEDGIDQGREDFEAWISHSASRGLVIGLHALYNRVAVYEFNVNILGTETLEEPPRTKAVIVTGRETASLHIEAIDVDSDTVGVRGVVLWSHRLEVQG